MFVCNSAHLHYYNFRAKAKYLLKKSAERTLIKHNLLIFNILNFRLFVKVIHNLEFKTSF